MLLLVLVAVVLRRKLHNTPTSNTIHSDTNQRPQSLDEKTFLAKEEESSACSREFREDLTHRVSVTDSDLSSGSGSSRIGGSVDALREKLLEMQIRFHSQKKVYSQERSYLEAELSALHAYIERLDAQRVTYWTLDDPPPL